MNATPTNTNSAITTAPKLEAKLLYRRLDALFRSIEKSRTTRRLVEAFLRRLTGAPRAAPIQVGIVVHGTPVGFPPLQAAGRTDDRRLRHSGFRGGAAVPRTPARRVPVRRCDDAGGGRAVRIGACLRGLRGRPASAALRVCLCPRRGFPARRSRLRAQYASRGAFVETGRGAPPGRPARSRGDSGQVGGDFFDYRSTWPANSSASPLETRRAMAFPRLCWCAMWSSARAWVCSGTSASPPCFSA